MALFFDLPRELRDMIYMAIVTWERLRPTLEDTYGWPRLWDLESAYRDGNGCVFSTKNAPSTCANILTTNRQVNEELMQTIDRARRNGLLLAKMDCIANRGETFYFTWLSIPIVHTTNSTIQGAKNNMIPTWAPSIPAVRRLLVGPHRRYSARTNSITSFEQLQIDVRLFDNDLARRSRLRSPPDSISWAICAALKRMLEHDHDAPSTNQYRNEVTIDTLILNVIPINQPTEGAPDGKDFSDVAQPENVISPREVARALADVWNKLWSGDDSKARYYRSLLEKIQRVRVCVAGVLVRERELRLELERGQAERRRIAIRVGW